MGKLGQEPDGTAPRTRPALLGIIVLKYVGDLCPEAEIATGDASERTPGTIHTPLFRHTYRSFEGITTCGIKPHCEPGGIPRQAIFDIEYPEIHGTSLVASNGAPQHGIGRAAPEAGPHVLTSIYGSAHNWHFVPSFTAVSRESLWCDLFLTLAGRIEAPWLSVVAEAQANVHSIVADTNVVCDRVSPRQC